MDDLDQSCADICTTHGLTKFSVGYSTQQNPSYHAHAYTETHSSRGFGDTRKEALRNAIDAANAKRGRLAA